MLSVGVITADTGNFGVFHIGVHQHRGDVGGFQFLNKGTVQLRTEDHQGAEIVFIAKFFEVWRIFACTMLHDDFVVIVVCSLLEAGKYGVANLRGTAGIHILKQNTDTLGVVAAAQRKPNRFRVAVYSVTGLCTDVRGVI